MPYLNVAYIMGHLGKDPELKASQSGVAIAKFSVATSDPQKVNGEWQSKTIWHFVTCFGDTAERVSNRCRKGDLVMAVGKINNYQYQTREGDTRNGSEVIASTVKIFKKADESPSSQPNSPTPKTQGPIEFDDDIPF